MKLNIQATEAKEVRVMNTVPTQEPTAKDPVEKSPLEQLVHCLNPSVWSTLTTQEQEAIWEQVKRHQKMKKSSEAVKKMTEEFSKTWVLKRNKWLKWKLLAGILVGGGILEWVGAMVQPVNIQETGLGAVIAVVLSGGFLLKELLCDDKRAIKILKEVENGTYNPKQSDRLECVEKALQLQERLHNDRKIDQAVQLLMEQQFPTIDCLRDALHEHYRAVSPNQEIWLQQEWAMQPNRSHQSWTKPRLEQWVLSSLEACEKQWGQQLQERAKFIRRKTESNKGTA